MSTVTVTFPSTEKRTAVHDAVKGHAQARDDAHEDEIRLLFPIGQAIGQAEHREPSRMANHPMFSDRDPGDDMVKPQLEVTIEFQNDEQRRKCREFLASTADEDLHWLADQF